MKLVACFHYSHDTLLSFASEKDIDTFLSIESRIEYIKITKAPEQIRLRLHLIRRVKGLLPKELCEAAADLFYAGFGNLYDFSEHERLALPLEEAKSRFYAARLAAAGKINALHAIECPNCPWDGATIFSKGYDLCEKF